MSLSGTHTLDLAHPYGRTVALELTSLRELGVGVWVSVSHNGEALDDSLVALPTAGRVIIEFATLHDPPKPVVSAAQHSALMPLLKASSDSMVVGLAEALSTDHLVTAAQLLDIMGMVGDSKARLTVLNRLLANLDRPEDYTQVQPQPADAMLDSFTRMHACTHTCIHICTHACMYARVQVLQAWRVCRVYGPRVHTRTHRDNHRCCVHPWQHAAPTHMSTQYTHTEPPLL